MVEQVSEMEQLKERYSRVLKSIFHILIFQSIFAIIVDASPRVRPPLLEQLMVRKPVSNNEIPSSRNKSLEVDKDQYLPLRFVNEVLENDNDTTTIDWNNRFTQPAIGDHSIADALAVQHHLDETDSMQEPIIEGKFDGREQILCVHSALTLDWSTTIGFKDE